MNNSVSQPNLSRQPRRSSLYSVFSLPPESYPRGHGPLSEGGSIHGSIHDIIGNPQRYPRSGRKRSSQACISALPASRSLQSNISPPSSYDRARWTPASIPPSTAATQTARRRNTTQTYKSRRIQRNSSVFVPPSRSGDIGIDIHVPRQSVPPESACSARSHAQTESNSFGSLASLAGPHSGPTHRRKQTHRRRKTQKRQSPPTPLDIKRVSRPNYHILALGHPSYGPIVLYGIPTKALPDKAPGARTTLGQAMGSC